MLLSRKTTLKISAGYANIIGHMCYAAYKLWNVCNYERYYYQELKLDQYPDWYYQKSHHKDNVWFKSLPSQTAQEVCKQLDKAWKSFYHLQKTGGTEHPRPPRFKQEKMAVTYMQKAVVHERGSQKVRLSISKQLREYMCRAYGICEKYLYLENSIFQSTDTIKQIKMYPPEKEVCRIIVIYEMADIPELADLGRYVSIDLGLHNLMTCYDTAGKTFIIGRRYLNICHYYDRKISSMQTQWAKCQTSRGVRYPKPSGHLLRTYQKKKDCISDYLHKVTRYVADYCREHQIAVVVIGDITNIRKGKDLGKITNQKLHSLPYKKIYKLLAYKLALYGIRLMEQEESYSSQCPPCALEVSRTYAVKSNRKCRGLYVDETGIYNADAVGAYNIMRKYLAVSGMQKKLSVAGLSDVTVIKAAV